MSSTITNIVSFGDAAAATSGLIVAEIDGAMHLDAEGQERSDFVPGEAIYLLLHYDPAKVRIIRLRSTDDGDIQPIGQVSRQRSEQLTFHHPEHLLELRYQPSGPPTVKWYGRTSNLQRVGKTIKAPLAPCLGDLSYPVLFEQYLHVPTPVEIPVGEEFPVGILIEYQEIS